MKRKFNIKNLLIVSTIHFSMTLSPGQMNDAKATKSILMIEVMGSANLVRKARNLGYDVTILTANTDQRVIPSKVLNEANRYRIVDTHDEKAVLQAALELNIECQIDAVIPGNEFFVVQSARVAEKLGLKSQSIKAAESTRNKDETLRVMRDKGVPVPRFQVVSKAEEISEHADEIQFPAILKPVDSAASDKVFIVDSLEEAQDKLTKITQKDNNFAMWGYPLRSLALFEEYVPGQEYSVEGLVVGDKPTIYSITARESKGFMEYRDLVGSLGNPELEAKIQGYVIDTLKALEVTYAPFHMELRLNASGEPRIMEIGTRIAGGHVPDLIDLSKGVNFASDYFSMLTDPIFTPNVPEAKQFSAIQVFYDPAMKKVNTFSGTDKLAKMPWVKDVEKYHEVGDDLPDTLPLFTKILGHVIFVGDSLEDMNQKTKMIEDIVQYN